MKVKCECGQRFTPSKRGKPQQFCSVKCRMRAYRKRAAEKRNVTTNSEALETIALLRKENTRLRRLLAEAREQIPEPDITFPITITGGKWVKIKSTTSLRSGTVIRLLDDSEADHLILEKEGKTLRIQALRDGTIGVLSIYDAKSHWKLNTRAGVPKLLKKWREKKDERRKQDVSPSPRKKVPCPICQMPVKLIEDAGQFCVPKHRHDLNRRKTCHGSNVLVEADGTFKE